VARIRDIAIFIGGSVLISGAAAFALVVATSFALVVALPYELRRVIKNPEA
jgi:hypothetical protein